MTTLMRSGRDRRSENPRCATRGKSACFWLGPISGSHQGQQPERLHLEAGYMTAPVSFREKVRFFSLAPRAPSIHRKSGTRFCCDAQHRLLVIVSTCSTGRNGRFSMRRREFIIAGMAAAWPFAAHPQQQKTYRIGVLVPGGAAAASFLNVLREELRNVEGQNLLIEFKSA